MRPEQDGEGYFRGFGESFARWSIELPPRAAGDRGSIAKAGWSINYRYLTENGEERLYVFASHRMTNDRLLRIDRSGDVELVDACREFYSVNEPGAEQEYFEANRRFYEQVEALGLL
jgi:hypothetical protein